MKLEPHYKNIDFENLAKITEGLTCADIIEDIIGSAARSAANQNCEQIEEGLLKNEINRLKIK